MRARIEYRTNTKRKILTDVVLATCVCGFNLYFIFSVINVQFRSSRGRVFKKILIDRRPRGRQSISHQTNHTQTVVDSSPHPRGFYLPVILRKSLSVLWLDCKIRKKENEEDNDDGGDAFSFLRRFYFSFFFHSFLKSWKNISSNILVFFLGAV